MNWGQQDNTKDKACVSMNVANAGKWDAISCDLQLPYMCKFTTGIPITFLEKFVSA